MLRVGKIILGKNQMRKMEMIEQSYSCARSKMKTSVLNGKVISCTDYAAIEIAADHLRRGNVVALPTDTVYGVACSANDLQAIQKLYELKGRDETKPVAICVSSIDQLRHYGEAAHLPTNLLEKLLPGAVTVVLNKSSNLNNPYLNIGIAKIGIRIPDYDFIQKVSAAFVAPIALTSANKSGDKSTLEVHEFSALWQKLGVVIDGGHLGDVNNENKQRSASTVIDLSVPGFYQIIRNGIVAEHTLNVMREFTFQTL